LLQALSTYQLWDELVEFSKTSYLATLPENEELHLEWSRHVGTALALSRSSAAAEDIVAELTQRLEEIRTSLAALPAATEEEPNETCDAPPADSKQARQQVKGDEQQTTQQKKQQKKQKAKRRAKQKSRQKAEQASPIREPAEQSPESAAQKQSTSGNSDQADGSATAQVSERPGTNGRTGGPCG
jgi:outer membrane biosynthesis protein TonB